MNSLALLVSLHVVGFCLDKPGDKFSEVEIEPAYAEYLRADRLLMEVTGAKVLSLRGGDRVILAVASTVLKDNSAQERLRAEKVCRVKALASVVGTTQGVQVCRVERLTERTAVVLVGEVEKAASVSELLQTTQTKVEGVAKDMAVVGRWKSPEGDVFYLAIGGVYDRHGKPVVPQNDK